MCVFLNIWNCIKVVIVYVEICKIFDEEVYGGMKILGFGFVGLNWIVVVIDDG